MLDWVFKFFIFFLIVVVLVIRVLIDFFTYKDFQFLLKFLGFR